MHEEYIHWLYLSKYMHEYNLIQRDSETSWVNHNANWQVGHMVKWYLFSRLSENQQLGILIQSWWKPSRTKIQRDLPTPRDYTAPWERKAPKGKINYGKKGSRWLPGGQEEVFWVDMCGTSKSEVGQFSRVPRFPDPGSGDGLGREKGVNLEITPISQLCISFPFSQVSSSQATWAVLSQLLISLPH